MEQYFSNTTSILIQGITANDLELMISKLLDKKLANISSSTTYDTPSDKLYKHKEASERIGISTLTLDAWVRKGIIEPRKICRRKYYTESDINNAMEKAKTMLYHE